MIVVVAIVAAPGRLRVITSAEESAQGRIQAWAAGVEMLKSKPVLGVGFAEFTNWHERVAHNSFVHVFAETGFVGIFFFVGTFYWFFVGNGPLRNVAGAVASPMARDLWASCIGAVVCACFLSRQYVPVLYIPLALGAVRIGVEQAGDTGLTFQRWWDWCVVAFLAVAVVTVSYVAVRALVVWSV